jgi:hypothetical protein
MREKKGRVPWSLSWRDAQACPMAAGEEMDEASGKGRGNKKYLPDVCVIPV